MNQSSTNLRSTNRRSFLKLVNLAGLAAGLPSPSAFGATAEDVHAAQHADAPQTKKAASPETLLLKDYRVAFDLQDSRYRDREGEVPHHRHALASLRQDRG